MTIRYPTVVFWIAMQCGGVSIACQTGEGGREEEETTCTLGACEALCELRFDLDAGLNPWSRIEAACVEDGNCLCREIPCDSEKCNQWCAGDAGMQKGYCEIFECVCLSQIR